jgi:hypothetical protein
VESQFYCPCGNCFTTTEVEDALSETIRATRELFLELQRHRDFLVKIDKESKTSFKSFLEGLAEGLGEAAGFVVERVVQIIFGGS